MQRRSVRIPVCLLLCPSMRLINKTLLFRIHNMEMFLSFMHQKLLVLGAIEVDYILQNSYRHT